MNFFSSKGRMILILIMSILSLLFYISKAGAIPTVVNVDCQGGALPSSIEVVFQCNNTSPVCGNGTCEATESCSNCTSDCGACPPICGNGTCETNEDCSNCSGDCGTCPPTCGNGTCETGETCSNCASDCGACPPVCGNGSCETGEDCGSCSGDCGACPPVCGDGSCEAGEDCNSCSGDCGTCPPPSGEISFVTFGDLKGTTGGDMYNFIAANESDALFASNTGDLHGTTANWPQFELDVQNMESVLPHYGARGNLEVPIANYLAHYNVNMANYYFCQNDLCFFFFDYKYPSISDDIENITTGAVTTIQQAMQTAGQLNMTSFVFTSYQYYSSLTAVCPETKYYVNNNPPADLTDLFEQNGVAAVYTSDNQGWCHETVDGVHYFRVGGGRAYKGGTNEWHWYVRTMVTDTQITVERVANTNNTRGGAPFAGDVFGTPVIISRP